MQATSQRSPTTRVPDPLSGQGYLAHGHSGGELEADEPGMRYSLAVADIGDHDALALEEQWRFRQTNCIIAPRTAWEAQAVTQRTLPNGETVEVIESRGLNDSGFEYDQSSVG